MSTCGKNFGEVGSSILPAPLFFFPKRREDGGSACMAQRLFSASLSASSSHAAGEWLVFARDTLAATVVLLWASQNVVSLCEVSGRSMQPALNPDALASSSSSSTFFSSSSFASLFTQPLLRFNDRVLATRWAARRGTYKASRGDVVILRAPDAPPVTLVKRVAAVEGDIVRSPKTGKHITIPRGHCWIEGDNAACSRDSSSEYGPVPTALITGRVAAVVWPPWRAGPVGGEPRQELIVKRR